MIHQMLQVRNFHEKMDISPTKRMNTHTITTLLECAAKLKRVAEILEPLGGIDERYNRIHLIAEETGEFAEALAVGDEEKAFDGLCDLAYVVLGSAIALDLPLSHGFEEVHRSNMTKEKQPDDEHGHRVRKKGPNYSPPDLKRVLSDYRQSQMD